jgi:hypothetical protein
MFSRSRARAGALLAVCALGGIALAGCGTKTIDNDDLQSKVVSLIGGKAGLDVKDLEAKCPADQKVEKGHTFTCTLTSKSDGSQVKVVVTETNDEGGITATVPADQKVTTVKK